MPRTPLVRKARCQGDAIQAIALGSQVDETCRIMGGNVRRVTAPRGVRLFERETL
jgi:hypothetical protein